MRKYEAGILLDDKVKEVKGVKGFLLRKVWPIIRELLLEILLDALSKKGKSA